MSSKPWAFGLTALLHSAVLAGAAERGVTIEGVARAASLMQAIGEICVPFGANAEEAEKFHKAFVDAGAEAYGPKFAAALAKEAARRRRETRAQDADAWCAEQKTRQDEIGNTRLFAPEKGE